MLGVGVAVGVDAIAAVRHHRVHVAAPDRSSIRSGEQSAAALTSPEADVATSVKPQKPVIAIGPEPLAARAEPLRPLIPIRPLDPHVDQHVVGDCDVEAAWQLPSTVSGQFDVIRSTPPLTLRDLGRMVERDLLGVPDPISRRRRR